MTDWLQTGSYANALQGIDGLFNQRANLTAGRALAQGNTAGASAALYNNGDIAGGRQVQQNAQTDQTAATARQLQFTLQAARGLRQVREQGGDIRSAYDALRPALRAMGTPEDQVEQLGQQIAANPQFLDQVEQVAGTQLRELSFQKSGDNLLVFEQGNPDPIRQFQPPAQPIEVGGVLVDPVTYEPILDTREPKTATVQNSDGSSSIVQIDAPTPVSNRAPVGGVDVIGTIQSLIPGVSFNSGLRTAEQNRSAGGAERSYHLRGQAVDIPPQQSTTPEALKAQLQAQGVDVRELINEGDHWHIAWGNDQRAPNYGRGEAPRSGGARVVAQGADNGPTPAGARAEAAAARAEARDSRVQGRQERQDSRQLRRDFESQEGVKEYETVRSAYDRLQALTRSGSATDDTAVGFEFMKMLDPTSVVRESEYALVGQSQGIGGQALVALQRLSTGQRLTPELRRNLVETAGRVFQGRQSRYNELVQQYRGYAEEDGFDPNRVVPLRQQPSAQQPRTNAPGLRFNITEPQLQRRQAIVQGGGRPNAPLGGRQNPRYINPTDPSTSYGNVRRGEYYVTPDGQLRGPKT